MPLSLADTIQSLALALPPEVVARLVAVLREPTGDNALETAVAAGESRRLVRAMVTEWQREAPTLPGAALALALEASSLAAQRLREAQRTELLWTGPESRAIPLRRTDQALLELIRGAQSSLHIVSFAVFRVPAIADALVERARAGVRVALYLETPDTSEGKIAYDTVRALGPAVERHATIYVWPRERRDRDEGGRHGSLHAKLALADEATLYLSSANLTGYALSLNMEMGIVVRGGPLPTQVAAHLAALVRSGDFVPL